MIEVVEEKRTFKKMVKEHKKDMIMAVVGAGLAGVAYRVGLNKGMSRGILSMSCAVYADCQGAAAMVESWLKKDTSQEELKGICEYGNKMIANCTKK